MSSKQHRVDDRDTECCLPYHNPHFESGVLMIQTMSALPLQCHITQEYSTGFEVSQFGGCGRTGSCHRWRMRLNTSFKPVALVMSSKTTLSCWSCWAHDMHTLCCTSAITHVSWANVGLPCLEASRRKFSSISQWAMITFHSYERVCVHMHNAVSD